MRIRNERRTNRSTGLSAFHFASKAGVNYTYGDAVHKHAVTGLSDGSIFGYDLNGNMNTRQVGGQSFALTHDEENRLETVAGAATASFVYNGDGQRVLSTQGGVTTVFIGNYYEWTGSTTTAVKYYYAGSTRVAMRRGSGAVTWLMSDHLSSTSVSYDGATALHQGYKPWGATRFGDAGIRYQFTGQAREPSFGLDFFEARWYDSRLGRFVEADSIIPEASQGTQAWDRYAYTNNNPLRYTDPTGHMVDDGCRNGCTDRKGAGYRDYIYNDVYGDVDKEANAEKVQAVIDIGFENIIRLVDPIDWALTINDCLNGDCSVLMILLTVTPGVSGGLGKTASKTVGHHTIPKQILKLLPPEVAKAVRGVRGSPNIWQIPESLHKTIHSGPGSVGYYNAAWRKAILPLLESDVTPQQVIDIRNQLVAAFGLWHWKP